MMKLWTILFLSLAVGVSAESDNLKALGLRLDSGRQDLAITPQNFLLSLDGGQMNVPGGAYGNTLGNIIFNVGTNPDIDTVSTEDLEIDSGGNIILFPAEATQGVVFKQKAFFQNLSDSGWDIESAATTEPDLRIRAGTGGNLVLATAGTADEVILDPGGDIWVRDQLINDGSDHSGSVQVHDTFIVTGTSNLKGAISNSTGVVVLDDDFTINEDLIVTLTTDLQGTLKDTTGILTVDDDLTVNEDFVVTLLTDLQGAVQDSTGIFTIADSLNVDAAVTLDTTLGVTGITTLANQLVMNGVATDIISGSSGTEDLTLRGTPVNVSSDDLQAGVVITATNTDLQLNPHGTGDIVFKDDVVFDGLTTDVTTGTNEDWTVSPNGSGDIVLDKDTYVTDILKVDDSNATIEIETNLTRQIVMDRTENASHDNTFYVGVGTHHAAANEYWYVASSTTTAHRYLKVSESGNVFISNITSPVFNASAGLELYSTDLAFLPSRMNDTQRNAMTAVNGMIIYNTTDNVIQAYENGGWVDL